MKIFKNKKIYTKDLRSLLFRTAKSFGVNKITFNKNAKHVCGTYNAETKSMFIAANQTKKELLLAFFHELAHHVSFDQKKWLKYHLSDNKTFSAETAFEIENKIDKKAFKLWNKYVELKQWGKYKYFYPKQRKTQLIKLFK